MKNKNAKARVRKKIRRGVVGDKGGVKKKKAEERVQEEEGRCGEVEVTEWRPCLNDPLHICIFVL